MEDINEKILQMSHENEMLYDELITISEKLREIANEAAKKNEADDEETPLCEDKELAEESEESESNTDDREIMVTVIMNSYNQADFIAKALDSIFVQEVNFRYNVIIGDDASTDGTADIIMEYYERYPDCIIPIIREENIGCVMNSYDTLTKADGKYIAILEGEDLWVDTHKLQKQVDFLEEHPEYSGCTHKVSVIDHNGRIIEKNPKYFFQGNIYSWKEYLSWTLPSNPNSWVYRNIFKRYDVDPTVLYKASDHVGDTTQLLLLLQFGDIYNFNEVMAYYRRDFRPTKPSWSALPLFEKQKILYKCLRYYENYAATVMHRTIKFTNTKALLTSLFTMCCDNPSRYKLDSVNEILNGLQGEDKEQYETLYKTIKFKTPFRKMKRKRSAKKRQKLALKQREPKQMMPQILNEIRSLRNTQNRIIGEINNIKKDIVNYEKN